MSSGMPELGSKISLISKADIRYEGRLYTVDPQECTIALSSVRSFGTEDRETQFQIAPQSQIYDYILFRGSDIKDIRVVNNSLPHPNDPAIMQVQLPNGQHMMPHFPMSNMNPQHAPPMGSGNYVNQFGGLGSGLGNMSGSGSSGIVPPPSLAPGSNTSGPFMLSGPQQQHQQHHQQQQQQSEQQGQQGQQLQQQQKSQQQNMLAGASRSTTPISLISRKSPLSESEMLAMQPSLRTQKTQQMQQQNNGGQVGDMNQKRQQTQQHRGGNNQQRNVNNQRNGNIDYYPQRMNRDTGRNMDNFKNPHNDMRNNYKNQRMTHMSGGSGRDWTGIRGMNNTNLMRNRGGGGSSGGRGRMQNQGFRPMAPAGIQNKPGNNKIKFEQDFDFEQANTKFEELCSQMSKVKVAEEPKTEPQINGETDKKDDSGNETGAGEHEPEDEEITVGYDKTKSFFDNISCEAAQDRSKNKKNDWRQERKLNSETFGVSSTRRGSYRGRDNFYNRNVGGNFSNSGGYNRGYRGPTNNYRIRINNRSGMNIPRDNSKKPNTNNNTNNPTTDAAGILKNRVQQSQPTTTSDANAISGISTYSASTSKSAPQENKAQTLIGTAIAASGQ